MKHSFYAVLFAAFVGEIVFLVHSAVELQERMAIVEAKLEILMYDHRHNPAPEIDPRLGINDSWPPPP